MSCKEEREIKEKIKKFIYFFGDGRADGNAGMKKMLGGKGANLAEMTNLGIPVPPGFTITTEVCDAYYKNNKQYPKGLAEEIEQNLARLEKLMGAKLGDLNNPLLVSVRSGAAASMPGSMDTVLNLGLNDHTLQGLIQRTQKERFAYDSYRRFIQMYSNVVLGMDLHFFESILEAQKKKKAVTEDGQLQVSDLKEIVEAFKAVVKKQLGREFPQDPTEQLWGAIGAVFLSWDSPRAITYRKIHHIPSDWGTAVNVQAMVFGNLGDDCATGVAFTRNPSTGDKKVFGEYLINAQGEDVVAGIRTPAPLLDDGYAPHSLERTMPQAFQELINIAKRLEIHFLDIVKTNYYLSFFKTSVNINLILLMWFQQHINMFGWSFLHVTHEIQKATILKIMQKNCLH